MNIFKETNMNIGIRDIIAILIVCIIAIPAIAGIQPLGTPFDDI
jgi:hypothetical protein